MRIALLFTALAVAAAATTYFSSSTSHAGAGESQPRGVFEIRDVEDHAAEATGDVMLGFIVLVDGDGRPLEVQRTFRLPGVPPRFHESLDVCRIYRWELQNDGGAVLESGRFLDRLALYAQQGLEEGCEKTVVQSPHTFVLRTPWHADARRLVIEAVEFLGDTEEERR